jgi:hypothetical protein
LVLLVILGSNLVGTRFGQRMGGSSVRMRASIINKGEMMIVMTKVMID